MIKEDWFKEWFDSEYYHILYKSRDKIEAQEFMRRLMEQFNIRPGLKVIDIACGKGRHSTFINSLGFDVTGIDLSPESIAFAKQNETNSLRFQRHDMRDQFKENHFDIALNLFTSFGYFKDDEENQKSINAMASNLKPGGHLVIDFLNVDKVIPTLPNEEFKTIDGITFDINKSLSNGFITKIIDFEDNGDKYHFTEYVKNISKKTFISYLEKADLELIHIFGDYQLGDFDESESDRLILISRKA
tara:strand:+ start:5425 stop:6159 length:735 start_codon:yes stop_codon:yes gene_type:complete